MNKRNIVILLILISTFLKGQDKSVLYDNNGKLIADSTYSISVEDLPQIIEIEKQIINQILEKVKYPEVVSENHMNATLIASIFIDDSRNIRLKNIIHKELYFTYLHRNIRDDFDDKDDPYLDKEISDLFNYRLVLKSKGIANITLHIPFKFVMTSETVDKNFNRGCFILQAKETVFTGPSGVESGGVITEPKD